MNTWHKGVLREDFSGFSAGHLVYYRKWNTTAPLSNRDCWWIRPQGVDHFWSVTSEYAGATCGKLISNSVLAEEKYHARLNTLLKIFLVGLPLGGVSHPVPSKSLKPRKLITTL